MLDVLSQVFAMRNEKNKFQAAAQAADYNAAVARQRSEATRQIYGQREEQLRRKASMEISKQRAFAAQGGLGMGGSNGDAERQSEVFAELDALNIRYEGNLEATGYENEGRLQQAYASTARRSAKNTRLGWIGVGSRTLAGTAEYYKLGQSNLAKDK